MPRSRIFALAVVLLACRPRGDEPAARSEPPQQRALETTPVVSESPSYAVEDTANPLLAIYDRLRAIGVDRARIQARLGEPRRATRDTQPDPNDSTTIDTLVHWMYDKLEFTFLLVGHDILAETRASVDYTPIASIIGQLMTPDQTQERLGLPRETLTRGDTTVLVYVVTEAEGGLENDITLHFLKGRLVQIGALPFLD